MIRPIYKLRDWVVPMRGDLNRMFNIDRIAEFSIVGDIVSIFPSVIWQPNQLSANPDAVPILEKIPSTISTYELACNPNAIHLIEELTSPDTANWEGLSANPRAIHMLEQFPESIDWVSLSKNPNAIHMLLAHPERVNMNNLSSNLSVMEWANVYGVDSLNWCILSANPNAVQLLEEYPEKIHWRSLSVNPNAIHLLEQNQDKIDWMLLSANPNAIRLLEQNQDKIDWRVLSANPNAIHLLEQNQDKIFIDGQHMAALSITQRTELFRYVHFKTGLACNENIFTYDYPKMREAMKECGIAEELAAKIFHIKNKDKWVDWGFAEYAEIFGELTEDE